MWYTLNTSCTLHSTIWFNSLLMCICVIVNGLKCFLTSIFIICTINNFEKFLNYYCRYLYFAGVLLLFLCKLTLNMLLYITHIFTSNTYKRPKNKIITHFNFYWIACKYFPVNKDPYKKYGKIASTIFSYIFVYFKIKELRK